MGDVAFESAGELARRIRSKEISSLELTEHYIERIERLDGDVNAVVVRRFDEARTEAKRADAELASGGSLGPLHGVPYAAKDLFDVEGEPTRAGTRLLADNIAGADATTIGRLRDGQSVERAVSPRSDSTSDSKSAALEYCSLPSSVRP